MIDCLVFSKDRACQLDLLLRSIDRWAPRLYGSITVLWTASEPVYERGYRRCIADSVGATFWREYDFHANVAWWLATCNEQVSFLVDDDVFYAAAPAEAVGPLTLRGSDYDYPFSVDGNVYPTAMVRALLDGLAFKDPTELEAQGHIHRDRLPAGFSLHRAEPCLVGVPANRVSRTSGMGHMQVHEYDLNERYLAGERIKLPEVEGTLPAHAELIYEWLAPAEAALA
jgi:hypothetical protein